MPDQITRVILFDFVGVLLFPRADYFPEELVEAIDRLIGMVSDDASLRAEARRQYHLTGKEFNQVLAQVAGKYAAFPSIWELLPGLRKRQKLGILNNGTYLTYPIFNHRYHLDKRFDLFLSSAREGICKPDARIYLLACERLGVLPEECLFMDDSEENISAARQLGMCTIHWPNRQIGFQRFMEWVKREV